MVAATPVSPVSPAASAPLSCRLPDPLLLPYLQASSEAESQARLQRLLYDYADPIIGAAVYVYTFTNPGVLQRRKSTYEEEVRSETVQLLLKRLKAMRDGIAEPITDFRAYTKLTARHECYRYLRRAAREKPFSAFTQNDDNEAAANGGFLSETFDPVQVMDIVLNRDGLRALWCEIMQLPSGQRDALLFSVRDGNSLALGSMSAVDFFLECGIVTRKELADALNVEVEDLPSFLKQLPFCDCTIAERMGPSVSAASVKNMRTAARRRLARRVPFVSM